MVETEVFEQGTKWVAKARLDKVNAGRWIVLGIFGSKVEAHDAIAAQLPPLIDPARHANTYSDTNWFIGGRLATETGLSTPE